MRSRITMDQGDAQKIAKACKDHASRSSVNVTIAIVDDAGTLMYFERMDGAPASSGATAIGKAQTAASLGIPSKFLGDLLASTPGALKLPGIPIQGGVPVISEGQCIGAVGVSGAQAQEDEDIAAAGASAAHDPAVFAPTQQDAERGVRESLARFNECLTNRDLSIVEEFSPSTATLKISPTTYRCRGREELEAFYKLVFSVPSIAVYSWKEFNVSTRGDVAWVFAEGEVVSTAPDGVVSSEPYRLAGVLELNGDRWQWRLFHGSTPGED